MSTILVLPGDGIGKEVCEQAVNVLAWFNDTYQLNLKIESDLVGGAAFDAYGVPLRDETMQAAHNAKAILLGAVGGPQYDNVERDKRPEAALLALRKELDLFANLRPAIVFDPLVDASSLKPEIIKGLDILILRELTAGVYFGLPRGISTLDDGSRTAVDSCTYSEFEISRIADVAFDLARKRQKRVHSVEKANVMETGVLWRDVVSERQQKIATDIDLQHMLADNCSMQLLKHPHQFDVILTDNLFGDMLSDTAAMLTGSLGMLPSASLSGKNAEGKQAAMYEPVHGSAPDIAGQNKANPLATILSLSMMMRYSLDRIDLADNLDKAVNDILNDGLRTFDTATEKDSPSSCSEVGQAVIDKLKNNKE
jgi:3-isopropylmalate dehydrogenase